jgi:hypothetical protein
VDFPIILSWGKKRLRCQSRQISVFGMFVGSTQSGLVGEQIRIDFPLEAPIPALSLSGIVSYAVDGGMGIRFHGMDYFQRLVIQDYVQAPGLDSVY